jgi:HD-GYP domain-containing protein (c-di-GMP phosphodiesterase class II)
VTTPTIDVRTVEATGFARAARQRRLPRLDRIATFALASSFVAGCLVFAAVFESSRHASPLLVAALVAAYALYSRVEFQIGPGAAVPTQLAFVPMLFTLPLDLVAPAVAAGFLLGAAPDHLRRRIPIERSLHYLANSWHALGAAIVLALLGEPSAGPVLVVALVAQFGVEFVTAGALIRAAHTIRLRDFASLMSWVFLVDAALAPVGLALVVVGDYGFALAVPLVGLLSFFARERRVRIDHALELSSAYRGTALLLGDVVEADDAYTGSHSRHVVDLVLATCDKLRLSPRDRRDAEFVALLHDVGKIRIPAEIINKPGALDEHERAVIETHTIEGEQMLERVGGVLGDVGRLVRSCHERWDGAGYPDRLAGEEIPLVARIVCACDAFSAMTTDRPYRKARSHDEALAELQRCSGTQFDPAVVEALADVV